MRYNAFLNHVSQACWIFLQGRLSDVYPGWCCTLQLQLLSVARRREQHSSEGCGEAQKGAGNDDKLVI